MAIARQVSGHHHSLHVLGHCEAGPSGEAESRKFTDRLELRLGSRKLFDFQRTPPAPENTVVSIQGVLLDPVVIAFRGDGPKVKDWRQGRQAPVLLPCVPFSDTREYSLAFHRANTPK